ncbi:MAG: hypothetical protein KatS3mg124_1722 [Porticoccaceae bacterium]|nr:MAG: hypothetical protein KatS3mg124_1722 [Porticoccaceae bacterium]
MEAKPLARPTYQEILDQERVPVPAHLRLCRNPDPGDLHLDPRRYTCPRQLARELEHVFYRTWQFACREEDIPEVGDAVLYEVGELSLIVVRAAPGEIRAYHNSCLHRGRRLVSEPGRYERFRCPYHAWTWDLEGRLRFQPCREDFAWAEAEGFDLPRARVDCWQGFVFVNADPQAPPLLDYLEVLPDHFRDWDLGQCAKVIHVAKEIRCNWKAAMEAFMESYHVIATHPQILEFMGDCNAQYDILGRHVSRAITANAVASPHVAPLPEERILAATLAGSGRVAAEAAALPPGTTARRFLAERNRESFAETHGRDYSQTTDAELLDAILYLVFPNTQIWGGYLPNIVYRARPLGGDPDRCLFEVLVLERQRPGAPKPRGVAPTRLGPDEPFAAARELGVLGEVFDQDMANLPHMAAGLRAATRNGRKGLLLGRYQEARIAHLHRMLDEYIARGEGRAP